jgi:hypothetical protein
MDINKTTVAYQTENRDWLGSQHGIEATETITLDFSAFASNRYPNGYIPSGVALAKSAAQVNGVDVYGPYLTAGTDSTGVVVGHLFNSIPVPTGGTGYAGAPMLTHGKVRLSKLPFQSGAGYPDATGQADGAGRFRYLA